MVSRDHCFYSTVLFSLIGLLLGGFLPIALINTTDTNSGNYNTIFEIIKNESKLNTINESFDSYDSSISEMLINQMNSENIAIFLKALTKRPQLAGLEMDLKMAQYVYDNWINQGLDHVDIVNYTVLLSYPNATNPSTVSIVDKQGSHLYTSHTNEVPLNATAEEIPIYKEFPPFLAYSPSTGSKPVIGDLVYVNYGRAEDFDVLQKEGISLKGKLAIARYGKVFRGDKLLFAYQNGAIGLILYMDPLDFTDGNINNTYPNSIYLPQYGVQRGTVYIGDGDPLTPDYPSIDGMYRIPRSEADLPQIPVHAISYLDAQQIMSNLSGKPCPKEWIGGLKVNYNFGPGYENGNKVELIVTNRLEERTIHNVIGIIDGEVEPDRYVLLGNHRDSWTFGAVDPSSGTAVLLELSRAFAEVMRKEKWRPRRSVVFCDWAAEEYGLIGSTEWIEQNQKLLQSQAVAYLNVDIAVEGNFTFSAASVPLLFGQLWEATKRVENPNADEIKKGRPTVYDTWLNVNPWDIHGVKPGIDDIGAGSDHTHFIQNIGISSLDMGYTCDYNIAHCYPLYHTLYETYELQSQLMDRGFKYARALGQIWIEMARSLADSVIIPASLEYYPIMISQNVQKFKNKYSSKLRTANITLDYLEKAAEDFQISINQFIVEIERVDLKKPLAVRRINDLIMMLERAFIETKGSPVREDYHHVIIAPSALNDYSGSYFSALYDLMWKVDHQINDKDWQIVKQYLSVVVFHIRAASQLLRQTFK